MKGGADISKCGTWRYSLWRPFDRIPSKSVLWVMLNPSTADGDVDDPTIRKCMGFTERWGYPGMTVVNVFAFRSTDPVALHDWSIDATGPFNDVAISAAVDAHPLIVAAWGNNAVEISRERVQRVRATLSASGKRVMCLKKTKTGQPWHPLYVPYSKALEPLEAS